MADWWRARAQLRVAARTRGPQLIEVVVENSGSAPVRDAVVTVALAPDARVATVDGATPLEPDDNGARLLLPTLDGGQRHMVVLHLSTGEVAHAP